MFVCVCTCVCVCEIEDKKVKLYKERKKNGKEPRANARFVTWITAAAWEYAKKGLAKPGIRISSRSHLNFALPLFLSPSLYFLRVSVYSLFVYM